MRVTHVITRLIVGGAQENTIDSVLGLRTRPQLSVDLISGKGYSDIGYRIVPPRIREQGFEQKSVDEP